MRVNNNKTWNPDAPEVPVDKDGNWLNYPDWTTDSWVPVSPFYAELLVSHMESGRSSKTVVLKDITNNKRYPMFVADFVKGIQEDLFAVSHDLDGGKLNAYWTACKRGQNYGIRAVGKR